MYKSVPRSLCVCVGDERNISISVNTGAITTNGSEIHDFCGLCGNRNGDLLKRDGSIANITNMAEVQNFAQCNLVEPRDQILRPQRRECGESVIVLSQC